MMQPALDLGAVAGDAFPAWVYSAALGRCFPCRILAESSGHTLIAALYHDQVIEMCVPASIVLRRARPETGDLEGATPLK